jgi:hypothetical protein
MSEELAKSVKESIRFHLEKGSIQDFLNIIKRFSQPQSFCEKIYAEVKRQQRTSKLKKI